jgi:ATP-dependent Clp endopeptidase proteolytic subunit ClpP
MSKKFFNIIATGNTATIWLYGDIGDSFYEDVCSADIARELKEAEGTYKKIEVRINSCGGDVYAGIAIYNALRNSKADIGIYVDGIAASMASVIALCGKPVQMSQYARLMLHSVSGGCYGTKEELKEVVEQIESLEGSLCQMYAQKTGMTSDEIKAAYFDGKDHYLTAAEALSIGFIDGIYDAEPVPEDRPPEQIYQLFNTRLNKPQNNTTMSFFENFKKHPRFKDVASDDEVLRIIGTLETEAAKVPNLTADVQRLTGELKGFQDKAKTDEDAAKKQLLDAAIADGRINETQRSVYQALLDKDRENGEAALAALPVKKKVLNDLNVSTGTEGYWEKRQQELRENRKKR